MNKFGILGLLIPFTACVLAYLVVIPNWVALLFFIPSIPLFAWAGDYERGQI
jgi:hypothetical protein